MSSATEHHELADSTNFPTPVQLPPAPDGSTLVPGQGPTAAYSALTPHDVLISPVLATLMECVRICSERHTNASNNLARIKSALVVAETEELKQTEELEETEELKETYRKAITYFENIAKDALKDKATSNEMIEFELRRQAMKDIEAMDAYKLLHKDKWGMMLEWTGDSGEAA